MEALEKVSLQTLSPKALAQSQALDEEVRCHKAGNAPKSVKMAFFDIDGIPIFCEVSKDPRPMVPKDLRPIIVQTFHGLAHPKYKETTRRISEFYYWPRMKEQIKKFVQSCHACQSTPPPQTSNLG